MTRVRHAIERWRSASLRRRLLMWLLPAACVIGLVASAGTYWGALRELDDLLDDQMRSMSKQIVVGPNGELSFSNRANGKHGFEASDPDAVLLHELMRDPGAVISREQFEERLYSWGEEIESNAVQVHIHNLRKKLGHDMIRTVRGVGYRIGDGA